MRNSKYGKSISIAYIRTYVWILLFAFLFFPVVSFPKKEEATHFSLNVRGEVVGTINDISKADALVLEARKRLAGENEEIVYVDAEFEVTPMSSFFAKTSTDQEVIENIYSVLKGNVLETKHRAYKIKINEYTVNVKDCNEVRQVLRAALNKYDTKGLFDVKLEVDPRRELSVLTTIVYPKGDSVNEQNLSAGVEARFDEVLGKIVKPAASFEEYAYGLTEIDFDDEVEVVEAFLPKDEITPLNDAIEYITKDQEKNTIYEVVAGDTLSEIALTTNVPLDKIIELNEMLENENSIIRVGDELIVTIPEPELSVVRTETVYYEEDYDLETKYIYNDSWYTNESVTRQQPSAGHRNVVADVVYKNKAVKETTILKEEVTMQPVEKIVEVGTKTPPTYIKPLSGGRMSSGFGRRWGRMHKGIDWATPTGTAIMASCGGTVARAGWASGYGYVIYINHEDGRQTRYGHLSKILVKAGDRVKQGQKVALSGNTGRSTGPHLHFEILINGSQVNPLAEINK